jgi:DUF971 family protein
MLDPRITPLKLILKKDEQLEIQWQDGLKSVYPISLLRTLCPCAACKIVREETGRAPDQLVKKHAGGKLGLAVLPGNFSQPLRVLDAALVGNYALRIDWSDQHSSGIYSFQYLRDISPQS